ncbi:TPA: lpg2879 family Dot/Icm T4SS effector [Legionella pneumophila]|nr:lpg2879 family Dot/Icm T4SS effector [Legionella pneumophila]
MLQESIMKWFSSVVNGVKTIGSSLWEGSKWVWNNASLSKVTTGLFSYTANTTFQVLEQAIALRDAVPTLVNNPQAKKIAYGMGYILVNDVLPLVALNFANNTAQNYFREGYDEDASWYAPYSLFLSGLTLTSYLVRAYTWRQGVQTVAHVAVLDSLGPSSFNSNKKSLPPSICDELDCNYKRKIKGWGREPLVLMGNDALTYGVSLIPYVGEPLSKVLRVYFNGRYIIRLTTPELCERHKYLAMKPESVLGFGLTFEATSMLMDKALESTVGMPPFLYYRALRHLLLLLHINVAAHMELPKSGLKDKTSSFDPFNIYERVNRFVADVIFSGLIKRIPIDFKPDKDAEPLIPLSPALKFGTMVLNMDLEKEKKTTRGFFSKAIDKAYVLVLPPVFRGANGLINDPIVFMYWPTIRSGAISAVEFVEGVGKTKTMATLAWAPKTVAAAINLKFGIPKKVTRFVLMLSKEEDFWNLATAFKLWFERHNIKGEPKLITGSNLALNGVTPLEPTPISVEKGPIVSPQQLIVEKDTKEVVPAKSLLPVRSQPQPGVVVTISPDSLFSTRKRRVTTDQEKAAITELSMTK